MLCTPTVARWGHWQAHAELRVGLRSWVPRVEQVSACLQKLKSGWIHFRALANEMLSTSRLPSTPTFPSDLSLAPATAHLSETVRASSQPASQPAWEPKIGTLRGFHVGVTHWKNNLFRRWKRSWLAGELEQSMSFRHTFLRGLLAPSRMPAAGAWPRWASS